MRNNLYIILLCIPSLALADANSDLRDLLKKEWQYTLKTNPVMASQQGDYRYNQHWKDLSATALNKHTQHLKKIIKQLHSTNTNALNTDNRINHALYLRQQQEQLEFYQLGLHFMPISMRDGIHTLYNTTSALALNNSKDYTDWLARLKKLPQLINQTKTLMTKGIEKKLTQPQIIMQRVSAQLVTLTPKNPEQSPFYQIFNNMPDTISKKQQIHLQKMAKTIIRNYVSPAYSDFTTFFNEQYLPACRKLPGIGSVPNGKNIYRYSARHFTTTDLTPEEIHQLGLQEVARNRTAMQETLKAAKFTGTLSEFMTFLRTDPQFYYTNSEALLEAYRAMSKRLDPELVSLFGKLPRTPYGVRAIPEQIAPDTTTAYYQPLAADGSRAGYYYVNLYKPNSRPKWEIPVLSVHEAVPGHHLQIALAAELEQVPEFRKHTRFTAYVEGWALYSERLGYQMGLYNDPYARFGQLTYDMWRSVRLVVDTGIHYFGWSRQKAIDYFKDNAAKTEQDIVNEIDRYIGWPGQALGYKIGQLKILELRSKAEKKLGKQFDIRQFHDQVLSTGAVPLDILEKNINEWIKKKL